MQDVEAHRRLQQELWDLTGHTVPDEGALVSIESFFAGNRDVGSIAPNLVEGSPDPVMRHPGVDAIGQRLAEVRARPEVSDVLVDVMIEWEEYPEGEWPYAQAIQVVTSAAPETVDSWIAGLNADPCAEVSEPGGWVNAPEVPSGHRIITIWWD